MGYARERKHQKKRRRAKLARLARKRSVDPAAYASIALGLSADSDRNDPDLATMEPEQFVRRIFPLVKLRDARKIAAKIGADRAKFERMRARLSKRNSFYDALDAIAPWLKADEQNGRRMYSALGNVVWTNAGSGEEFSMTFRQAGGVVAKLRGVGEEYLDFYCSAPEGLVCQTVFDHFAKHG